MTEIKRLGNENECMNDEGRNEKIDLKHAHTHNITTLKQRHLLFSFLRNIFFHPERATKRRDITSVNMFVCVHTTDTLMIKDLHTYKRVQKRTNVHLHPSVILIQLEIQL